MQNRAKEGSTKANMHTFQLAAEDYGVQNDGAYANTAAQVAANLPAGGANFKNPFTPGTAGTAYADVSTWARPITPSATAGMVSYCDSSLANYQIAGYGKG